MLLFCAKITGLLIIAFFVPATATNRPLSLAAFRTNDSFVDRKSDSLLKINYSHKSSSSSSLSPSSSSSSFLLISDNYQPSMFSPLKSSSSSPDLNIPSSSSSSLLSSASTSPSASHNTETDFANLMFQYVEHRNDRDYFRNIVITVLFAVIFFVSLFGNTMVCYIVINNRKLHTFTNYFILNLSVADLLMTVINIPFGVARLLLSDWPFGSLLCKCLPFIQATSVYVSTITMAIISIDRYCAIVNPFGPRLATVMPVGVILIIIWLVSFALAYPFAHYEVTEMQLFIVKIVRCSPIDHDERYVQGKTMLAFFTQYLIPLTIASIAYIGIFVRIHKRRELADNMTQSQYSHVQRSNRQTVIMLVLVLIVFASAWLPLHLFYLFRDFVQSSSINLNVFLCLYWLAMSSVCYNPFIYSARNKHFRKGMSQISRCFGFRIGGPRDSINEDLDLTVVTSGSIYGRRGQASAGTITPGANPNGCSSRHPSADPAVTTGTLSHSTKNNTNKNHRLNQPHQQSNERTFSITGTYELSPSPTPSPSPSSPKPPNNVEKSNGNSSGCVRNETIVSKLPLTMQNISSVNNNQHQKYASNFFHSNTEIDEITELPCTSCQSKRFRSNNRDSENSNIKLVNSSKCLKDFTARIEFVDNDGICCLNDSGSEKNNHVCSQHTHKSAKYVKLYIDDDEKRPLNGR